MYVIMIVHFFRINCAKLQKRYRPENEGSKSFKLFKKGYFYMNYRAMVLYSLLFVFSSHSSNADEFAGTGSRWPVAQTKAIATDNAINYVFVGDGDTLSVFNKTSGDRVAAMRFTDTTEGIRALVYHSTDSAKVLYAACGYSGLQVVNVENPLSPTQAGTTPFVSSTHMTVADFQEGKTSVPVRAYDISIHGDYAYIADNTYGLRALSLNTPFAPKEVGYKDLKSTETTYSPLGVGIYATGETANVNAVMILNSANGPVIASIPVTGFGGSVLTFGRGSATGLPTIMGSMSVLVKDRYAYCVDSFGNDLIIYDVSHTNANAPELVFSQRTGDSVLTNALALFQPRAIDILGNYAYITTYNPATDDAGDVVIGSGLNVLNISNLTNPLPIYRYNIYGANSVRALGDDVFVTSQSDGLYKLNITFDSDGNVITPVDNPPAFIEKKTLLNASDIQIVNNEIVFLSDNQNSSLGGLTILRVAPGEDDSEDDISTSNLSSPAFPVHETFFPTPGQAKSVCITDTFYYGFVADGHAGIQFLNFRAGGLTAPQLVSGSNLPISAPYEVIDVDVTGHILVALTTDPSNELWAVDVSTGTSVASPFNYSGMLSKADLAGTATAHKLTTYTGAAGTYALIANGTSGLTIVHLTPDDENMDTITLPPAPENVINVATLDARSVYANSTRTGIYAYVADGAGGVKVIRLYREENLADMNPEIVSTITTTDPVIDVGYFEAHLYVLTENPNRAVLLYDMSDVANPRFIGYSSSYGKSSALFPTEIRLPCTACTTGFAYIKGVFIADGPGGIAFRQVTDEDAGIDDRIWPNDKTCFISNANPNLSKTGLFPVYVFLFICLAFLCLITWLIREVSRHKP